jgi:hypothetical protein
MLAIFTLLVKNRMIDDISNRSIYWDISCAGEQIRSKIVKESRIINVVTIVNLSFSVVAMFSFIFSNPNDYFVIFTYRITRDWFPNHHLFVEIVLRSTNCDIFRYDCTCLSSRVHHASWKISTLSIKDKDK